MPASLNYNVDKGGNITQTQYRWAFVCVDALTKVAWIYPIEQLPNREAMQGTGQERTKGAHSPQATQTMDGFQKFVHRINRTREQYWATQMDKWEAEVESKYLQNLEQSEVKDSLVGGAQPLEKPKELKPVLITHDNGAEFGGTKQEGGWQPNIRDLREKYQGKYYKETITPIGRSQYNSIAERFIRTIRRYFHTRYQQHQQNKNKNKTSIKRNIDRRRFSPILDVNIINPGEYGTGEDVAPFAHTTDIVLNRLKLVVWFHDRLSSEIKDEICSKLASALRALKSRISRICGINELERRVSLAPEAV